MSIAQEVCDTVTHRKPATVCFQLGKVVDEEGQRYSLPPAKLVGAKSTKGKDGRWTLARFRYKDGSVLEYTHDKVGSKYNVIPMH